MAALAGTAVVPPRRRTPCDTRRTSRHSKSEFTGWAKLYKGVQNFRSRKTVIKQLATKKHGSQHLEPRPIFT